MKKLVQLVCLASAALFLMGAAPSIKNYDEKVNIQSDFSSEIVSVVELADLIPGKITLPLASWQGIKTMHIENTPPEIEVEPVLTEDNPYLDVLLLPGAPSEFKLTFKFNVPAPKANARDMPGSRTLAYKFLNSSKLPVDRYSLAVILPHGEMMHSTRSYTPRGRGGVGAQVKYISENERHGFSLENKNMKFGDVTTVNIRAVQSKKSWIMLIAGIIFSALYLFVFRDIVSKNK